MRIGLIVPGFSADEGDWCIPALRGLVRELARRHDVRVFALRYPHRRAVYRIDGAGVHSFGGALAGGVRRVGLIARAWARIAAEHRRRPLDVLHGVWADEPGFLAVAAAASLRLPAVVSLMGGELACLPDIGYGGRLGRVGRALIDLSLRRADAVTVGSAYLRRMAEPRVTRRPLLEIPLGIDPALFHPHAAPGEPTPLREGEVRLLHVGSLVPVKDQETLLRSLALLADGIPRVHLHIVGEGPLRGPLEDLAAALGIAGGVTFHGAVPHGELPRYYRAADLCVLSSRHESQSMVALEAAACGRVVVGTAVGILPELAPWARVVPVGDATALAAAVRQALRESPSLPALPPAEVERHTVGRRAAELCDLYARLSASA